MGKQFHDSSNHRDPCNRITLYQRELRGCEYSGSMCLYVLLPVLSIIINKGWKQHKKAQMFAWWSDTGFEGEEPLDLKQQWTWADRFHQVHLSWLELFGLTKLEETVKTFSRLGTLTANLSDLSANYSLLI